MIEPEVPKGTGTSPASPCVRQCCLDDADVCVGCGRTLDEIKAWHVVDDAGRGAILRAAEERRRHRGVARTAPRAAGRGEDDS